MTVARWTAVDWPGRRQEIAELRRDLADALAVIQDQNRRLAVLEHRLCLLEAAEVAIVTATLVAVMAAAIVIAAVGWYDAERRCQWQRCRRSATSAAPKRPMPGAISSSVTLTATRRRTVSWRSATPRCTQRTPR